VTHQGIEVVLVLLGDVFAFLLENHVLGVLGVHLVLFNEVFLHTELVFNGGKLFGGQVRHGKTLLDRVCAAADTKNRSERDT